MALFQNTAEGGSNATTVTSNGSNTGGGSGTQFSAANAGITFSNTQKAHGGLAYAFAGTAATFNVLTFTSGDGTTSGFSARCYVYLTGYPSAETAFITIQNAAAGSVCGLNLSTTGLLRVVQVGGSFVAAFTTALALNTWHRVAIWGGPFSATTGTINVAFYPLDSLIATESHNYTARNTGTVAADKTLFGKLTQAPSMTTYYFDDVAQDMTIATEIGPAANTPPTIDAGADQNVSASATVNLSGTGVDPDGGSVTHAWTFDYPASGAPSLTGASTATPSFTAGSAGSLYVLRDTVTETVGGLTAFDTVEVRVPSSGTLTPLPAYTPTGTGSWTNVGGAASEGAALADASDSTYVESPISTGTEANRRWRLIPSTSRGSADIVARIAQDVSGSITVKARLYENSTLRQEWNPVTVSTTPTDRTLSLSGGTISAITDWGNLYLELSTQA